MCEIYKSGSVRGIEVLHFLKYYKNLENHIMSTRQVLNIRIIFFVAVLVGLFLISLGFYHIEPVGLEVRFALFVKEMMKNGIHFYPVLYGKPYADYPATLTILSYFFSLLTGGLSVFILVLPTALAFLVTLFFTYLLGATQSRMLGVYGVLLSLLTVIFLPAAYSPNPDMFVAAVTVISFYLVYTKNSENCIKFRLLWVPLCFIIGFMCRGPIGFIVPSAVVFIYYLIEKKWKMVVTTAIISGILLISCFGIALYAAYVQGGEAFLRRMVIAQITGRFVSDNDPAYYYILNGFSQYAITFPLAIITVIIFFKKIFSRKLVNQEIHFIRALLWWVIIILLGLSIPSTKHPRYVLAITPAIALLSGYFFFYAERYSVTEKLRNVVMCIATLLPFLGVIGLLVGTILVHTIKKISFVEFPLIFPLALLLVLCICVIIAKNKFQLIGRKNEIFAFLVAFFTIGILFSSVGQSIDNSLETSKPFVNKMKSMHVPYTSVVFYQIGPDGEDLKYALVSDSLTEPRFAYNVNDLKKIPNSDYIIAKRKNFRRLPLEVMKKIKVIFYGKLGHKECVVFRYNHE